MSDGAIRGRRAANQADFAGPDADREAIERLARSARLANEQMGGGKVADAVLQRNTLLIEAAQAELDELMGEVAKLRGVLGNRKKVARADGCDVDAIVQALRLKKQAGTGGSEPIVAQHRLVGRILELIGHPLGTQFKLFGSDAREALGRDDHGAEEVRH